MSGNTPVGVGGEERGVSARVAIVPLLAKEPIGVAKLPALTAKAHQLA